MTREELFSYVKEEYAQEPDYPWENDFESAVIDTLIQQPGFHRAYHMNKLKWLTIELERVNETEIKNLIDMSYELTDRKLPKGIRDTNG